MLQNPPHSSARALGPQSRSRPQPQPGNLSSEQPEASWCQPGLCRPHSGFPRRSYVMPHALLQKTSYLLPLSYLLRNTCNATLAPTPQRAWQSQAWSSSRLLLLTSPRSHLAGPGKKGRQSSSQTPTKQRRGLQNRRPEQPAPPATSPGTRGAACTPSITWFSFPSPKNNIVTPQTLWAEAAAAPDPPAPPRRLPTAPHTATRSRWPLLAPCLQPQHQTEEPRRSQPTGGTPPPPLAPASPAPPAAHSTATALNTGNTSRVRGNACVIPLECSRLSITR